MKRISITENGVKNGQWFDAEKAELFKEDKKHDGNNWISEATGSQWNHEAIYLTKGGVFILNAYSDYQGSQETYEVISKEKAAAWFVKNNYSDEEIPSVFAESVKSLEVE